MYGCVGNSSSAWSMPPLHRVKVYSTLRLRLSAVYSLCTYTIYTPFVFYLGGVEKSNLYINVYMYVRLDL